MATQALVRRIALALPGVTETPGHFAFCVTEKGKPKGFVWVWMERVAPKAPRVANPGVIAVRVPNVAHRDLMIAASPAQFFTEPHYAGYPAVLVRLAAIRAAELRPLIEEGWRCMSVTPKARSHR